MESAPLPTEGKITSSICRATEDWGRLTGDTDHSMPPHRRPVAKIKTMITRESPKPKAVAVHGLRRLE